MRSWDAELLKWAAETDLVAIARDRRLALEDRLGPKWVDLTWVDEVALCLIDMAATRQRSISLVYPAPAGEVCVLLAAQLILHDFLIGVPSPALGLVTADVTGAARTWAQLRITTTGLRQSLDEVFPCFRARPEGDGPTGRRRVQGLVIGQRCKDWPVDRIVVDHLAGYVVVAGRPPVVEVFADPLDRALPRIVDEGGLVWGWSNDDLRWNDVLEVQRDHTVPFSVSSERLRTIASGVEVRVVVARHDEAETAAARVREDLRVLRSLSPDRRDRNVERGLSAAWHHFNSLTSLPCKPSRFDRFAGLPPMAARPTSTFAAELTAWAGTIGGDFTEIATILASDIADLRAALDRGNPFETVLRGMAGEVTPTIIVTRTRTAAKALLDSLGVDPDGTRVGKLTVCSVGRLHREGTWERAVVVGEPPPWDWHRVLSGLAAHVDILTLGTGSAAATVRAVDELRLERERWAGVPVRSETWRVLVGTDPPPAPPEHRERRHTVVLADGAEYVPEGDPFDSLTGPFDLDPLDVGGEGPRTTVAREESDGTWEAAVDAVEVQTDRGYVLFELGRTVEVRRDAQIVDVKLKNLKPGAVLLVGRQQGRVGLLEALEERLRDRPDLLAASFLLEDYRRRVRTCFAASGLTIGELHRALVEQGCEKTSAAVRSWVTEGTMAPQHFDDLKRLNAVLELGLAPVRLRELFAGVQRRRGFRRAAGRALAAAARGSTVVEDPERVDSQTGLSVAELREAVVEAVVISVTRCDEPVPLTLLGRLEDAGR